MKNMEIINSLKNSSLLILFADLQSSLWSLSMCLVFMQAPLYKTLPLDTLLIFLGSPPAAPVFMFSMGVFFILSSKSNDFKSGMIRGIKLLALGALLSFLRYDLLQVVEGTTTFADAFKNQTLTTLWEVDILQFAGWAYIFMSLIKRYLKKPIWWLSIVLCTVFISPLLWGITTQITPLDWFLQFFMGLPCRCLFSYFRMVYVTRF